MPFICRSAITCRANRAGHILSTDQLDDRGCQGAPDWIIEILSPATSQKDFTDKDDSYRFAGIREYWAVDPHEATVFIYRLDDQGECQLLRKTPFLRHETAPVWMVGWLD